ncbi:hypothetical protein C3L33_13274, partial [Rhododendron williamsianum]
MAASHQQLGHLLTPTTIQINGGGGFPTSCFSNNISNSPLKYARFPSHSSTSPLNFRPQGSCPTIRCQSTSTDGPKTRNLLDNASNLLTNFLSGGSLGSMPVAEGAVSDLFGRPLFLALYDWFLEHGSVYKLAFGPKAFVVVSDPVVARHILRENAFSYDKGVLADILEPIMGKGLIPADLDTWKPRRRALEAPSRHQHWHSPVKPTRAASCTQKASPTKPRLEQDLGPALGTIRRISGLEARVEDHKAPEFIAPGFHALYLESMVKVFTNCSGRTISKFEELLEREGLQGGEAIELNLEAEFSSLALDIIGLGVFNYDFGSVTKESPIIKAVYGTLFEAEHRSTFYVPYWKFPLARWLVPRQRKFQKDLKDINDCLDGLIRNAKETRQETDVEKLQQRDYSNLKDASLLRFLVDMRGADVDDCQLRDDLMTMLIAGHETTAAVLTWAVFLLAQNPSKMKKAQAEIDTVLGQGRPTFDSLKKLEFIRLIVVESLRLFPQPPLLIRRSLKSDSLPERPFLHDFGIRIENGKSRNCKNSQGKVAKYRGAL